MQSRTPKLGIGVAAVVAAFVLSALSALLWQAPNLNLGQIWGDAYYRHVTWFSFYQALLSTLLSVGLAVPVAHALSRRRFPGRGLLLKLF
ncbi:MAG: thiamine/thiamine pyrophosphate ABC transporter permease ThiP, partial [Vibrio fluvialis]